MKKRFNEQHYYIYAFLNDSMPIYPLYAVLFKTQGLSLAEIAMLLSFWSLVALLSEVPSGVLADRWNRKYMLGIATILKALCFVFWFASNSFVIFALGFLCWGISASFVSGTEEGLLYDNLKSENRSDDFSLIYGKGRFYSSLGNIVGVIAGGIMAEYISIPAISAISAAILAVNLLFIVQLREKNDYAERLKSEEISYFKTLSEAIALCLKNANILIGMIVYILFISIVSYSDEYDALIIDDFSLSYIWLSVIFGIRFIGVAIGNRLAASVQKRMYKKSGIFILGMIGSMLLLVFSMLWNPYGLVLFSSFCMIMTIAEVIITDFIQDEINEEGRTTVMSLMGFFQNLAMIVYSGAYALLTQNFSLRICYIIISLYCIVGLSGILFVNTYTKKKYC